MVYILYLVLFFFIYFILTLYWLIAVYSVSPFFIWPPFYSVFPFYLVNKDQINFYLSSIRSCSCCSCCYCYCFKSSSLVVVRRLLVPAKFVRIKKLCKTHYKCHYTTIKHAPVFMLPPYYLSSYPSKKNNYFYPLRI